MVFSSGEEKIKKKRTHSKELRQEKLPKQWYPHIASNNENEGKIINCQRRPTPWNQQRKPGGEGIFNKCSSRPNTAEMIIALSQKRAKAMIDKQSSGENETIYLSTGQNEKKLRSSMKCEGNKNNKLRTLINPATHTRSSSPIHGHCKPHVPT